MAFLLTFLGKGGTGRTTVAIAAAQKFAAQGQRVLLASQDPGPGLPMILGAQVGPQPQEISDSLQVVQLQSTLLLEQAWQDLKILEAEYVRTPFFKSVFGQELGILPGMDSALALNALQGYQASNNYDVIIYDGTGDLTTLRMVGAPEIFSWYGRRFRQVIAESDLGRAISPFVQPVSSAVLNVSGSANDFAEPTARAEALLEGAKQAIADPTRVAAYLVTTADRVAIATARYLWGSAQQVGLTIGGAILNAINADGSENLTDLQTELAPLPITAMPRCSATNWQAIDWQTLVAALPDFRQASPVPPPIVIDIPTGQVQLFLPGFDKAEVKLTQYGPEVTIEAGDQRRNIFLPPELRGKPVQTAKFHGGYLTLQF